MLYVFVTLMGVGGNREVTFSDLIFNVAKELKKGLTGNHLAPRGELGGSEEWTGSLFRTAS